MIRKILLACLLLAPLSLRPSVGSLQQPTIEAPEPSAELGLTGAFWSTEPGLESTLLMTNPNASSGPLRLEVFSYQGQLLAERTLELAETAQARISLQGLVSKNKWGYYRVSYPQEVGLLPAQTVYSGRSNSWVAAPESDSALTAPSRAFLALLPSDFSTRPDSPGAIHVTVVITNISAAAQYGTLLTNTRGAAERSWSVPPGRSRRLRLQAVPNGAEPVTLLIQPEGDGAQLVVSGYAEEQQGATLPLKFRSTRNPGSGELSGFYSSGRARALLWNLSEQPAPLDVLAVDMEGNEFRASFSLGAAEAREFSLNQLLGLPIQGSGALHIAFGETLMVIGSILDEGSDATFTPLRDPIYEAGGNYSLPIRLDESHNTLIRLFNPNDVETDVCIFLAFDEQRYTHSLKKMQAHQFAEIDLARLRDEGIAGELGNTIPFDFEDAQAIIMHHRADGMRRKVVASGYVEELESGQSRVFGCPICAPDLVSIQITTDPINGFVGSNEDIEVLATFSYGLPKFVSGSSAYVVFNTSVATVPLFSSDPKVHMNSPGSTTVEATFSKCKERPPLPGEGSACDCRPFALPITRTDTAPVRSIGVTFTPNPLDHIERGSTAPLTATVTPSIHSSLVTFTSSNTAVATISGSAPSLTVNGVGAGSATISAKIGSSTGPTVPTSVQTNTTFATSSATAVSGATPSNALGSCIYGLTFPENVDATISALRKGSQWCAMMTGLRGNYSLQARLLPGQTEVTGPPPGNTTVSNFRAQVNELNILGGCPGVWYMLAAVQAHENVHAGHFRPAIQNVAGTIETSIEGVCVSSAGRTQAQGITAIRASSGFGTAQTTAQMTWLTEVLRLAMPDHMGATQAAEHGVVDPMIMTICSHAQANGWPGSTPCP